MRTTLVTLLLSAAAVLGYLSYRALDMVPVAEQPAPLDSEGEAQLAERLPEFTLENLAREPQSIQSWPGKALIINFWATWCPPCLREIPMLKTFQDTHAERGIQVVGIAVDQWEPVLSFAEQMDFNYPVLVGQSQAIDAAAAFGVDFFGLPFTVFTEPSGRVLGVHTGELHAEQLEDVVGLLAELESGRIDVEDARARFAGRM